MTLREKRRPRAARVTHDDDDDDGRSQSLQGRLRRRNGQVDGLRESGGQRQGQRRWRSNMWRLRSRPSVGVRWPRFRRLRPWTTTTTTTTYTRDLRYRCAIYLPYAHYFIHRRTRSVSRFSRVAPTLCLDRPWKRGTSARPQTEDNRLPVLGPPEDDSIAMRWTAVDFRSKDTMYRCAIPLIITHTFNHHTLYCEGQLCALCTRFSKPSLKTVKHELRPSTYQRFAFHAPDNHIMRWWGGLQSCRADKILYYFEPYLGW